MPPQATLLAHLQAFFAGDRESLAQIAGQFEVDLLRMIRAVLRRHGRPLAAASEDPRDLVQNVYVALLRQRDRPRPPVVNGLAYLQRLVRNVVLERRRWRNAARRRADRLVAAFPLHACPAPRADDFPAQLERLDALRTLLRDLSPAERLLVVCRSHDWTFRQIAGRLGWSDGAARAAHRRILLRLKVDPK